MYPELAEEQQGEVVDSLVKALAQNKTARRVRDVA